MTRTMRCAVIAAVMLVLSLGLCLSASAASFPDIEGHWAQDALLEAVEEGWLSGFEDGTMRPDDPATGAQVASILCRILDAQYGSGTGEWYADAAAKAIVLGFVDPGEPLTEPLTRQRALRMVAEALQMYDAGEDTSCLAGFSDAVRLAGADRIAIAALVGKGYVSGYDNALQLSAKLTRAELCAILSRIFKDGEVCLDGSVSDWTGGTLWIGCGSGDVSLTNVTADTVVVRTQGLQDLTVKTCEIGTLVLAQDGDLSLRWPAGTTALRIGSGSGRVMLSGKAAVLSVTGAGREVEIGTAPEAVYISGRESHVTLSAGTDLAVINGSGVKLTVKDTVKELEINAENATVDGYGTISSAVVRAKGATLPSHVRPTEEIAPGLDGVSVYLDHPETLPVGETLKVSAEVQDAPDGLFGWVTWTVDGKTVRSEAATLEQSMTITHQYTYSRDMPATSHITFRFDYITSYGELQSISAEIYQNVENHDQSYYDELDAQRVLALVTNKYAGDGTTEWAEQHDYTTREKETWVNAKGYSSPSRYLIWINKTYQRVNIFEGEKGNWKLIQSGMVCTGAGDDPAKGGNRTPEGVWYITFKEKSWPFNTYVCRPVVRFYGGGIAMHSRLYNYNGTLNDATIGVPASHGCVRMMDEQIYFIYDNCPEKTTVVVH